MPAVGFLNAVNPTCAVNVCLQQVAGLIENTPVLYEACTSAFGAPVTTTFTVDSILSTATVPGETFTDVIVTLTVSTHSETDEFTQWQTVSTTATQTSTVVVTQTSTVTVPFSGNLKARSNPRRRKRACVPRTTEITTASPVPVPTNCADVAEFSSACKCIDAASDAPTVTVTVTEPTTANVVTVTQDVWTYSTETFTEHEVEWTSVTHTSTTTLASTTTVTVTTTTQATVTAITAKVRSVGSAGTSYLSFISSFGIFSPILVASSATLFTFPNLPGGGQPFQSSNPTYKFYVSESSTTHARIILSKLPSSTNQPLTCQLGQGGRITCSTGQLAELWECKNLNRFFIGVPGFNVPAAVNDSTCTKVEWWLHQ